MTAKEPKIKDITTKKFMEWDKFKDRMPEEALPAIYAYTTEATTRITGWYWDNIITKRITSLAARGAAFTFLLIGTCLQISATLLCTAEEKLLLTQLALAAIAVAALVQLADKIFGWSNGWIRYITTATTMEHLIRMFQLEWAKHLASKTTPLDMEDTKTLLERAQNLEQELLKLQSDETTKWVSEFTTGISLLDAAIRSQREDTEKKLDAVRTTLTSQDVAAKADEKEKTPGAIEINFLFKTETKKLRVSLNGEASEDVFGSSWSKREMAPGLHKIAVTVLVEPPYTVEKIVEIKAGKAERLEIAIPY